MACRNTADEYGLSAFVILIIFCNLAVQINLRPSQLTDVWPARTAASRVVVGNGINNFTLYL